MAQDTREAAVVSADGRPDTIKVTVTFPIGPGGPYREDLLGATSVGTVRANAMTHFRASEDPGLRYFLLHDGDEVADALTIHEVAGPAAAVKFTLARDVIQG